MCPVHTIQFDEIAIYEFTKNIFWNNFVDKQSSFLVCDFGEIQHFKQKIIE